MRWSMTRYCGGERVIGCAQKKYRIENPIKNCVSPALAEIAKMKDASGYNPEYSLEEGIGAYLAPNLPI
jgi:nucleoside-diphosphate-sugar epimerase